jgi:hypothetical protein
MQCINTMNKLHRIQDTFYNYAINASYLLIIFSFMGISTLAPIYLNYLDYYIRIYICLFLMWRFHPFCANYEFTDLDRKIAFSAGVFILTTTALNEYLVIAKEKLKYFYDELM